MRRSAAVFTAGHTVHPAAQRLRDENVDQSNEAKLFGFAPKGAIGWRKRRENEESRVRISEKRKLTKLTRR